MNELERPSFKRKLQTVVDENKRCIITDDGYEFEVDPVSLSHHSKYFKALFLYDFQSHIIIRGIPGETMKLIISFFEGNNLEVNPENVVELLKASDFMFLDELLQRITDELPEKISQENCIELYDITWHLDHLDVLEVAQSFVKIHFLSVVGNSNIGALCFQHFEKLISDTRLNIKDEKIVWEAIIKWVGSDSETRNEVVPLLLRCVRLDLCNEAFIRELMDHPLIQRNEFCRSLVESSDDKSCENISSQYRFVERIRNLSSESVCWTPRQPHGVVCQFSYLWDSGKTKISMKSMDGRKIMKLAKRKDFIPKFVFKQGHTIYAFDTRGEFFALDVMTSSLTAMPSLSEQFDRVSFVLSNQRIIALVVKNGMPSAEMTLTVFNPQSNEWNIESCCTLAEYKVYIYWTEATVQEDSIYVVLKGNVEGRLESFLRVYNCSTRSWLSFDLANDQVSSTKTYITMVSFEGALYYIGSLYKTVHRFDVHNRTWSPFQDLPHMFNTPRAVVHNGSLLVFDDGRTQSPVFWNENQQEWQNYGLDSWDIACEFYDEEILWKYHLEFQKTHDSDSESSYEDFDARLRQ